MQTKVTSDTKAAAAKKVIKKIEPSKLKAVMKSHLAQKSKSVTPVKKTLLMTKQKNIKIGPKKSSISAPKVAKKLSVLAAKKAISLKKVAKPVKKSAGPLTLAQTSSSSEAEVEAEVDAESEVEADALAETEVETEADSSSEADSSQQAKIQMFLDMQEGLKGLQNTQEKLHHLTHAMAQSKATP